MARTGDREIGVVSGRVGMYVNCKLLSFTLKRDSTEKI